MRRTPLCLSSLHLPGLRRLLIALPLTLLLLGCHSRPWAKCGQDCGSPCWPGPRLGCTNPCLCKPCPPEPACPEPKKRPCTPCEPTGQAR